MLSIRSAAALSAATIAACVACARSPAATRASCKAVISSSRWRCLRPASASSSATVSAAITVRRVSPISPNEPRRWLMRSSSCCGELHQMALLPVFAGHPVLPAVDDDIHLRHRSTCDFGLSTSAVVRFDHGADALDRHIQAPRDFAVGGLDLARARASPIEIGREPRAVARRARAVGATSLSSSRSASRRRSTAAARPSSARARRRVAASIALGSDIDCHRIQKRVNTQGFRTRSLKRRFIGVNAASANRGALCKPVPPRVGLTRRACYVRPMMARASAASAAVQPQASDMSAFPRADHDRMANAIRALAMDAVEQAKSGHPGLPMGAADIATVLFTRFLKFDPADPAWPDRDRFVLSAGHGSMLIYALLASHRLRVGDARRHQEFPQAQLQDAGPSGEFHHDRHRDHHRPARPGHRQCGRHGDRGAASRGACSAARSSITAPTCSPPTAT